MNYVHKLQEKMKEQGMDEEYIKLCSEYAQNLCDNNVPVIFDFKHLSLLLGYETAELAFYLLKIIGFIRKFKYRKKGVVSE